MSHPAIEDLEKLLRRTFLISSAGGLLMWDQRVNLPPKSASLRAEQQATLHQIFHTESTSETAKAAIEKAENAIDDLNANEKVTLKDARLCYDRATKIPEDFVRERSILRSESYHAWTKAREEDDFDSLVPYLEKQIAYAKRYAEYLGENDDPYDTLIDVFDPGMRSSTIDQLFCELKEKLVPIVREILDSPIKAPTDIFKGFPIDRQKAFLKEVTEKLGFDYERGRIDTTVHPFCGGTGADTRITTRFDVDNPLNSLFASIHETGHGLYEQGLEQENLHLALGESIGMGIHESQSRLWENQVSRSRSFWNHFEPKYREAFPEQLKAISSDELYLAINSVSRNPIRVDSDEVTYNLHIIIRFELEKQLLNDEITVADLPTAWNDAYESYLGFRPKNNREGVLQDVHWPSGNFGYFPSYCIGNMIAAQLWDQARMDLEAIEDDFASGNFVRLLTWLRDKVHRHGKRYDTQELVQQVCQTPVSPKPLIAYLKERYLPLYR